MRPALAWAIVGGLIIGATMTVTAIKPRGIRNRNAWNIEYNRANQWTGQAGTDGRYAIFDPHPEGEFIWGARATAKLLRNYATRYNLRTIAGLIGRFAPHSENPTEAYVDNVAREADVSPYQAIDLWDSRVLERVLVGMARQENGRGPAGVDWVPLADIRRGIELA